MTTEAQLSEKTQSVRDELLDLVDRQERAREDVEAAELELSKIKTKISALDEQLTNLKSAKISSLSEFRAIKNEHMSCLVGMAFTLDQLRIRQLTFKAAQGLVRIKEAELTLASDALAKSTDNVLEFPFDTARSQAAN